MIVSLLSSQKNLCRTQGSLILVYRIAILIVPGPHFLGRALGHFIFSLIGLKRILFTNIFKSFKSPT